MMKNIILSLLLSIISNYSYAGDSQTVPVPGNPYRFYKDAGGYHLDFNNGRAVTLYQYSRNPLELTLGLKQTENTCDLNQMMAQCKLKLDFAPIHYMLVWTSHPDKSKIGTLADRKISSQTSYYSTRLEPIYKNLFRADRLNCTNYDWTQELNKNADGSFIVDSWSSESMTANEETKINENQSTSTGFDILLKQIENNELQVAGIKADSANPLFGFAPYISAQTTALHFKSTKSQQICQITFESNLGNAASVIASPYFTEVNLQEITPVMELTGSMYLQTKFLIQNFIYGQMQENKP